MREDETDALRTHLANDVEVLTSSLSIVEVSRAAAVAGAPKTGVTALFERCEFVDVSRGLLMEAAGLASARLRTPATDAPSQRQSGALTPRRPEVDVADVQLR